MLSTFSPSGMMNSYPQLPLPPSGISTANCSQPTMSMVTLDCPRSRFLCARSCSEDDSLDAADVDELVRELDIKELAELAIVPSCEPSAEPLPQQSTFPNCSRQASMDTASMPSSSTSPWSISNSSAFFSSSPVTCTSASSSGSVPASPISSMSSSSSTCSGPEDICETLGDFDPLDSPFSPSSPILADLDLHHPSCQTPTTNGTPSLPYPSQPLAKNIKLPQRRGATQLWQFLLSLLDSSDNSGSPLVEWTNRSQLEFRLLDPEAVATQWGQIKNRPCMNYDKLSRSLRYYYDKGIMQKVPGERYVYCFTCLPSILKKALDGCDSKRKRRRSRRARLATIEKMSSHLPLLTPNHTLSHTTGSNYQNSSNNWYPCSSSYALPSVRDISVGPSQNALPLLQQYALQH